MSSDGDRTTLSSLLVGTTPPGFPPCAPPGQASAVQAEVTAQVIMGKVEALFAAVGKRLDKLERKVSSGGPEIAPPSPAHSVLPGPPL